MTTATVSRKEWKALYDAATEFRKIEPWRWMKETDIFGVKDPRTGEIGYCCIMGELGEVLAMAVYRGTEGLLGYQKILKGQIKPGDPDSLYVQDCLIVTFEGSRSLEKEDRQIIKDLGLTFRGRNAWPVFRDYKPGYFPWFLDRDAVLSMTAALQQAKDVCLRALESTKLLRPSKRNLCLVRVPEVKENGVLWKDEWKAPASVEEEEEPQAPVDEIRIQRIKKVAKSSSVKWEIDFFYTPTPVAEGGRPYFPYAIMIVDQDSGFVHGMHLTQVDRHKTEFIKEFLSCIEQSSILPEEILLRKEEAARIFEPYTSRLNIKLTIGGKLKHLDKARRDLEKHLRSR